MTEQRKLAAVMFTDIVGYTTLMSRDEQKALTLLKKNRDLQKSLVEKHNGDFLKEIGDGTLLCFPSALDAVRCAMEIQSSVRDDPDLNLRIGIHLGDIVFKDGDVFGDGVNVASRIEHLPNSGDICISEAVNKILRNHPEIKTVFIGVKRLKNVDRPIKVFILANKRTSPISEKTVNESKRTHFFMRGAGIAVFIFAVVLSTYFIFFNKSDQMIDSIAVLPLTNLSANPEQEYFVDGITDVLISELAQISALHVISRTSIMQYKDVRKSTPIIARELRVDAIVEGTVFSDSKRVRITTQLIRAKDDKHLWANKFEYDLKDIFNLQSEVAQEIAREVKVQLTDQEKSRLAEVQQVNPETYQLYLKGRYYWNQRTVEGILKAIEYFNLALDKDSNYAAAYAGLADCYVIAPAFYLLLPHEAYPKARTAAMRALEIDDSIAEAYSSLAAVSHNYDWAWSDAERLYKKAIALNPNYATAHQWYFELLFNLNRFDEANKEIQRAYNLDPLSPIINFHKAFVYYLEKQYDKAISQFHNILELHPNLPPSHFWLGASFSQKKMHEEAISTVKDNKALLANPHYHAQLGYIYAQAGEKEKALQEIDKIMSFSNQERIQIACYIAFVYVGLGNYDQAFYWLEEAYEQHDYFLTESKVNPIFDPLRSDPRFDSLLKRLGLDK